MRRAHFYSLLAVIAPLPHLLEDLLIASMHRRSVRAISQRLFRPVHALAPFTASSRLFNPFHASYTTQRAFIHYKTTHNYEYTPQEGRILKGEFGDLKRDSKAGPRLRIAKTVSVIFI